MEFQRKCMALINDNSNNIEKVEADLQKTKQKIMVFEKNTDDRLSHLENKTGNNA